MKLDPPGLTNWLAFGERGISSEAIVHKLCFDQTPRPGSYPYDPADFRRCELLLRAIPILRLSLPQMSELGPVWAGLVANWDRLVSTMEEECPGVWERYPSGSAPRAYSIMTAIREAKP